MTRAFFTRLDRWFIRTMEAAEFILHNAFLAPGIAFWLLLLLLKGDVGAFMAFVENLAGHYVAAAPAARREFVGMAALLFSVVFVFLTALRWPLLMRGLKRTGRRFRKSSGGGDVQR